MEMIGTTKQRIRVLDSTFTLESMSATSLTSVCETAKHSCTSGINVDPKVTIICEHPMQCMYDGGKCKSSPITCWDVF